MSGAKEVRYIAKCKTCNCFTSALTSGQNPLREKDDPKRTGGVYTGLMGDLTVDCRKCGKGRRAKSVRGTFSKKHECNAKCLSSTGGVCECSCGGKNHGASYSAGES